VTDLATALAHLRRGEWQPAHAIVQADDSALACWAHGIVHALEGDVGNARYWYGRAQRAWPEPYDAGAELDALAAAVEPRGPET
jgi:hypothetical protein